MCHVEDSPVQHMLTLERQHLALVCALARRCSREKEGKSRKLHA